SSSRDRSAPGPRPHPDRPAAEPRGGARRSAPEREDDARAADPPLRLAELLRPRGPGQPGSPRRADDGPRSSQGNGRDRRGAAAARPLPRAARAGGPAAPSGPLPHPPQLGVNIPAAALLRFWTMVAHYHGNVWNAAEPARSLGVSEPTVRRYLDLLTSLVMVRQLQPWHENLGKRQVKSPKVYLRDSGL